MIIYLLAIQIFLSPAVFSVPPQQQNRCYFPRIWRDVWKEPKMNTTISIVTEDWNTDGKCVLQLEEHQGSKPFVLMNVQSQCYTCIHVQQLHSNILRYKKTDCRENKDTNKLCYGDILQQKWRYLYRRAAPQISCPDILQGSHSFTYSEYSPTTDSYVQECGEPVSEINNCKQRDPQDPQLSFNFGNCPSGVLVHRTSMTQSLKCVGSFSQDGVQFLVGVGEVWEYWEPGDYRLYEDQYFCMAVETNGLQIFLSQGFGSGCDGVGGFLSPRNGLRNLVMDRKIRLEENCNFPDWVTGHKTWQIIPQTGLRLTENGPREVTITSPGSFSLGSAGQLGQKFSCAKIIEKNRKETKLQMFSQSQCYGEYHCFHGIYSAETNSITLHVGAPTPNIETSCQAPHFDPQVPFLRITLLPANITSSPLLRQANQGNSYSQSHDYDEEQENTVDYDVYGIKKETMESLERETNAQIHALTNQFSQQLTTLIQAFVGRTKYLVQQQQTNSNPED